MEEKKKREKKLHVKIPFGDNKFNSQRILMVYVGFFKAKHTDLNQSIKIEKKTVLILSTETRVFFRNFSLHCGMSII